MPDTTTSIDPVALDSFWSEPCEGGLRFEVAHGGEWVPGRLFLPDRPGPHPLVLVQHGAGSSKDDPVMDAVTGRWVEGGAAIARIDFPLHGERHDPKLSLRILGALAPDATPSPDEQALWSDLARQAVGDLQTALAALAARPEIDPARIGYAGFSLGAILGASFCAATPQIRAVALALGGAGLAPAPFDAGDAVAAIAPRPILFVNTRDDERIPREAAEALHAAAGEPKDVEWVDGGHGDLSGAALKRIWQFLAPALGL